MNNTFVSRCERAGAVRAAGAGRGAARAGRGAVRAAAGRVPAPQRCGRRLHTPAAQGWGHRQATVTEYLAN